MALDGLMAGIPGAGFDPLDGGRMNERCYTPTTVNILGKLARLGAAPPSPRTQDTPSPESPAASVPLDQVEPADTLEMLQRRMAAILGKPQPSVSRPPPELGDLPFDEEASLAGPRFVRRLRSLPSHHVGRMPVESARDVRGEVLALLALDPRLADCDWSRALFIDTETTGLGGAGTVAFLVGTYRFDGEQGLLEQLLLRRPGEERALLGRVAQLIDEASVLVSFNGKSFDMPLLGSRCVMNRLPPLAARPHLDLLHVARRIHRARLGACRLTHLESSVLGFGRGEDIDGAEVPARYSHYLRSGDGSGLRAVVDHNEWDVVSMAALVGLYGEPLGMLHEQDLVGVASTYRRAGALEEAQKAAEAAVAQGAGPEALRARGAIAQARGDRASALRDFERLEHEIDDPAVRLILAKLYEHHVKEPLRALEVAERGTGEKQEATELRLSRLKRKIDRARNGVGT